MSDRVDRAIAKSILAAEGAAIGGAIGGPVGATAGALTGLIVGDMPMTFMTDYVAVPAHEYALVRAGMSPSHTILIKEGEVLRQVQPTEAMETEMMLDTPTVATTKKRKVSKYNRAYAKAFKSIAHKYKKKDGSWQKDGFKKAQRAAHNMAGGKK